jgi:hypothetical protein
MHFRIHLSLLFLVFSALFTGCADWQKEQAARTVMIHDIQTEEPGDYWIGRRYYKVDYKFWGWIRRPGQPWSSAKLVMMNEQQKLAPDRQQGHIGSDNGYEYKLYGEISPDTVYEPASNGFYPEFVLKNYELRSVAPANIYPEAGALDPTRRVIIHPS